MPSLQRFLACGLILTGAPVPSTAQVVINEIMAAGSDRLLRWGANGVPRLGYGTVWHEQAFDDTSWLSGNGPFGFGSFANVTPTPVVGTNAATLMQNLTPTLYLRKAFTATHPDGTETVTVRHPTPLNSGTAPKLLRARLVTP